MHAEGELVYIGTLSAQIEDANLGVGDTTVETRFRIGLKFFFGGKDRKVSTALKRPFRDIEDGKLRRGWTCLMRKSPYFCSIGNILLDDEPSFRF